MSEAQRILCHRYGASYEPPVAGSRMGVALQSLSGVPTYGIRKPPAHGTNGWYIWAGEWSNAPDFYQPVCIEHAADYFANAVPFLALPPGWAFITDGDYIDVWYDPKYLESA
jgi:hypothetical protein